MQEHNVFRRRSNIHKQYAVLLKPNGLSIELSCAMFECYDVSLDCRSCYCQTVALLALLFVLNTLVDEGSKPNQ